MNNSTLSPALLFSATVVIVAVIKLPSYASDETSTTTENYYFSPTNIWGETHQNAIPAPQPPPPNPGVWGGIFFQNNPMER